MIVISLQYHCHFQQHFHCEVFLLHFLEICHGYFQFHGTPERHGVGNAWHFTHSQVKTRVKYVDVPVPSPPKIIERDHEEFRCFFLVKGMSIDRLIPGISGFNGSFFSDEIEMVTTYGSYSYTQKKAVRWVNKPKQICNVIMEVIYIIICICGDGSKPKHPAIPVFLEYLGPTFVAGFWPIATNTP